MPEMPVIPAIFPSILATSLSPPDPSSPSDSLILTLDLSLSDLLLVCFVLSLSVMAVCGVIYALFYRPHPTPDPTPEPIPAQIPDPFPAPDPLSEDLSEDISDDERIWTTEQIAAHITQKITDCEARVTHMEQRMGNRNVAIAEQFNSLSDTLTAHVLKVARAHIDARVEEMMQILLDAQNDSTEDVVNARLDAYLRSFDERLNRFMRQVVELLVDCAQAVLADSTISDAAVERLLTGVYTEPQTTPAPKPSPKPSKGDPFADADFGDNVEDEEAEPPRKTAEVISLRDGADLTSEWAMELLRQRLNQEIAKEEARERARERIREEARAARRKAEGDERKEAEKKDPEDPDDPDDPPEDPDDPPADPFNPVA